jgi:hypothetical protein
MNTEGLFGANLRIECRSLASADARELATFLEVQPEVAGIRRRLYLTDSISSEEAKIVALLVTYGPVIAGAVGMKALEIFSEKIKQWYLKTPECKHRKIPLYGPDGEEITVVECDKKHPQK